MTQSDRLVNFREFQVNFRLRKTARLLESDRLVNFRRGESPRLLLAGGVGVERGMPEDGHSGQWGRKKGCRGRPGEIHLTAKKKLSLGATQTAAWPSWQRTSSAGAGARSPERGERGEEKSGVHSPISRPASLHLIFFP